MIDDRTLTVVNKCDLREVTPAGADVLAISALTGTGLDELLARLTKAVAARFDAGAAPALTRGRHRRACRFPGSWQSQNRSRWHARYLARAGRYPV